MNKKRLLELAGIPLTETIEDTLRKDAVRSVTSWYLEHSKEVYNDLAKHGELPTTEQGFLEIMKDIIKEQITIIIDEVRKNLDEELPLILRTLRRRQIGQKRLRTLRRRQIGQKRQRRQREI